MTTLVFHGDGDGICSAALMVNWLRKHNKKFQLYSPRNVEIPEISDDEVIVLDLAGPAGIKAEKVLWIDHHEPFSPPTDWEYINPRLYGKNKPTSLLVYEKFGGIDWIAALGSLSDSFMPNFKPSVPISILKGLIPVINSARAFGLQKKAVELLATGDLKKLTDKELLDAYFKMEEIVEEIIKENPEKIGKFYLLEFQNDHYISNYVASRLRKKYGGICIAANHFNGVVEVEIRTKLNVDLRKLVKPWGGGHERAAGATIPEEEWEIFLKRLRNFK